jgi:GT2 family glycosyltransferase
MLSVVIVNYHSTPWLTKLFVSVEQLYASENIEWIVVNNASSPDDQQTLQEQFSFINWHEMGYNAGFARACNKGIAASTGDAVLLLNPDTYFTDNSLVTCYNNLMTSKAVACGVQLYTPEGLPQYSASHFMRGGLNYLLKIPIWGSILKKIANSAHVAKPSLDKASGTQQVGWISGAFLMAKKDAINKAGMLDESFFLYGEEVEWCYRLGKIGSLELYGNLSVVHLEGVNISNASGSIVNDYNHVFDKKGLQLMVSNHLLVRKVFGLGWCLFHYFNYIWGAIICLIASPMNQKKNALRFIGNCLQLTTWMPAILLNVKKLYKIL